MKTAIMLILLSLLFISKVSAIDIKDVDMFGYVRAGVGTNTYGGDQECFYNQGAGGGNGIGRNEFRLANECSNYLELGFRFNHLKSETKNVYTQFRISNTHSGNDAGYDAQATNFVEAFAEIQGYNDQPYSYWVGKRFYRDQDVYIDDYYYFGSTNGNGAGMGNIPLFGGKLSLAYLRRVTDIRTQKGYQGITLYDARLKSVPIAKNIKQNFWIAAGQAPEGTNQVSGEKYSKNNGFVVGTLVEFNMWDNGFNHFAALAGQGVLNNFNLYGDSTLLPTDSDNAQYRLRFINHTTYNVSEKWAFHLSLNHERLYTHGETTEQWMGLGVRPVYRITPTFHLVTEAGSSIVQNHGAHRLMRLTIAPQLSFSDNIWGRPVLRAFYTQSFWNVANKANVAQNAPTYANKISGGAYGFQMETFF
ncbi:MAG: carbohydrate porin [Rhizobacter sp.]|nr:carbohydrate porin [Bacteriovorax sp.]